MKHAPLTTHTVSTHENPQEAQGRVLLLLTNLSPNGGAEIQSIQLALRLQQRGWHVGMVSLLPVRHRFAELEAAGILVESANMTKGLGAAGAFQRLVRIVRRFQPDILHCHMAKATLAGRLARLAVRVPVVINTFHGLMMYSVHGKHQPWLERLHRITDSLADATTIVCRAGYEYYTESKTVPKEKLQYLPNGVDTMRFRPDAEIRGRMRAQLGLTPANFTWILPGRFDEVKDHAAALTAFAIASVRRPEMRLLLSGDGPLRERLENRAAGLGITGKVQFLGHRPDIELLMNAADAVLLTSRFEALPLVLLEGAASGLPAVATRVGGNPEAIVEGTTGFLAQVGDPQAISEAMLQLASLDAGAYAAMASAARRHVCEEYGFDAVVDRWESLYRFLSSSSSASSSRRMR